jgi:hypothetical protein
MVEGTRRKGRSTYGTTLHCRQLGLKEENRKMPMWEEKKKRKKRNCSTRPGLV